MLSTRCRAQDGVSATTGSLESVRTSSDLQKFIASNDRS